MSPQSEWLSSRKQATNDGENAGTRKSYALLVGM
jgi:hypothetical protein